MDINVLLYDGYFRLLLWNHLECSKIYINLDIKDVMISPYKLKEYVNKFYNKCRSNLIIKNKMNHNLYILIEYYKYLKKIQKIKLYGLLIKEVF